MNKIDLEALTACAARAVKERENDRYIPAGAECRRLQQLLRQLEALAGEDSVSDWLADNLWLFRREGARAAAAFRGKGFLRRRGKNSLVTALAQILLEKADGSEEALTAFLQGARADGGLSEKEVCLFPAGLRLALLQALVQDPGEKSAEHCVLTLRQLAEADFAEISEQSDPLHAVFSRDALYPRMDAQSRADYRRRLHQMAKKQNLRPEELAVRCVNDGLHHALFPEKNFSARERCFIALYALPPLILSGLLWWQSGALLTALLLLLPLWELWRSIFYAGLTRLVPPRRLFRLELKEGIGPEGRTVCAVFALISSREDGIYYAQRLEYFKLCSRDCGENLLFALVADLPESNQAPAEKDNALLEGASEALEQLNEKYGGGFFLLTRRAVYNPRDKRWMPRERKRGAMEDLAKLIRGLDSPMHCEAGDARALRANYILALDSDSFLSPGAALAMIGAALHPLNRPRTEKGVVVAGHGLIHPRMTTELDCAMATDFARIHLGQGGTEVYGLPQKELLFDLFDRGGFAGKGLIDAACYLECMAGRIPDNRVLSHDTLEGAYLRGAFMGDAELTDTAPTDAFGWFRRLERWSRGDWQNLPWLFRWELAPIERFRIFDNLRRSLTPLGCFAALTAALAQPAHWLWGVLGFSALAVGGLLQSLLRLFDRRADAALRCRSAIFRGLGGALVRLGSELLLLPWNAGCGLFSALTALGRMLITKRRMLAWSVAGSSGRGMDAGLLFAMVSGLAMLLFCPGSLGRAAGLLWLATPLFVTATGWKHKPKASITEADRSFLLQEARAVWQYFSELCRPEDHYLPPDNFQLSPPKNAARRTSPTNIGLGLLCGLCAMDLKLCPPAEALSLIDNIMSTIEALPKWHGHLYNWYDTAAAAPLQPVYVSTVDSGNLCACLLCLKHGLTEYGRPDLAARAAALCEATEFAPLYDSKKQLFYIGLEPMKSRSSPSHYDLLASEARLTGFLAVARGDVPPRHWAALGRAQLSLDGWRGLASWSGSVFEYLMPELFLPLHKGSQLWETAQFCLYAQQRHARQHRVPWGNSESAFFALDSSMSWRYKAHGTGALALCRDMDAELVVSPYSSFLALCVQPEAAVKNLKTLKKAGMWGRFGFYEALDFTPGRSMPGGSLVPCFMAHHLGMSMSAVTNCLCSGALRRRFMAESCCAAYAGLLCQRVPLAGPVLRRSGAPRTPAPTESAPIPLFSLESGHPETEAIRFFPLSNGVYSLLAGTDGSCRALSEGVLMYRPDRFRLEADGCPLLPSPEQPGGFHWQYSGGNLCFRREDNNIMSTSMASAVSECGELRRVFGPTGAHITLCFEPVLAYYGDWRSHPSFWSLGLECSLRRGCVLIRRLPRGKLPELWLCLAATVPLSILRGRGWQMFGPVSLRATLPEGGCLALAIAAAHSRDAAMDSARRILSGGTADMPGTMGALLGMGTGLLAESFRLASALIKPRVPSTMQSTRALLWAHGISGDLPLHYVDAGQTGTAGINAVKCHALLTACGVSFDLVLNCGEGGEYLPARTQGLRRFMARYGLSDFEGVRGGIHFADDETLKTCAVLPAKPTAPPTPLPLLPERGADIPAFAYGEDGSFAFETPPLPPRVWQNVISNGRFGFIATDCGSGHMWLKNAREMPVTAWTNDPLARRGEESLELISPRGRQSLFADGLSACRVCCGFGWARWERSGVSVTALVPGNYAARLLIIHCREDAELLWHIRLRMAAEEADAPFTLCREEKGVLYAQNPRAADMGCFKALASAPLSAFTCDEESFQHQLLDSQSGAGAESCFAMRLRCRGTVVIACGFETEETLRALAQPQQAIRELNLIKDRWRSVLGRLRIKTEQPELDRMMNGWAAYQAIAGRLLGRSSIYQSGGAYGFRDQLQDSVNVLLLEPALAKRQILLCCERQFTQGDVLHWWHEDAAGPRGVRSRCSDDLIWLGWALCEYTEKTGDYALCRVECPWLEAEPLSADEPERYFAPGKSRRQDSVFIHALRAVELVHARKTGSHGLLLMGSGDWNDGMDRFGGESVWLTMFCAHTARRLSALAKALQMPQGDTLAQWADRWAAAANEAWDGNWYRRGYWPDGTPLGAAGDAECELDSISQSWAAFCPELPRKRVRQALSAAYSKLYDEAHGLTRLFTPPFYGPGRDPGYIRACGPGFRENGGQYTHGALWLAAALLREGMTAEGSKILLDTLPARHNARLWAAEPYVLAADVSANADHYGCANWSWYTGSAGWFFRVAAEDLLGIRLDNGKIRVENPALDYEAELPGCRIFVKDGRVRME